MPTSRKEKVEKEIQKIAGNFIAQESNRISLITPTSVSLSPDFKNCSIFISVLPEEKEKAALDFLKRQRRDFRIFYKKTSTMKIIPFFDFSLDLGEKNRIRIESISQKNKK